jgi:hypothetical protein
MGLRQIAIPGLAALLLASCGGGGGSSSSGGGSSQPSSAPHIVSLTPAAVPPGSDAFTLTVNGANFRSDSVVLWNDVQKPTTFVSSAQVTASIPKADVAGGNTITVRVNSASAGASDGMFLKVEFPKPIISSISKTSAQVTDPGFTLTVNGSNFFNGAHVQWDGLDRVTQFVSSTQLTAQILTGDIGVGGNHTIRVSNPSPNAGISDGVNLFVQAPKPAITSITPDTVYAAGDANKNQFTITGTNFIGTSQVYFDGQLLASVYVTKTPTQLTFYGPAIPRRLGPLEIKVSNDGGGPQTDAKNITLIASGTGISTSPIYGPLLTDDLSENIYPEHTDVIGFFYYGVSIFETCLGVPSCTPTTQHFLNLNPPPSSHVGVWPALIPDSVSADGRYFAYTPQGRFGAGQFPEFGPTYVYDRCKGATAGCAPTNYRTTVPVDGTAPSDDTGGGDCGFQTGPCFALGQAASISSNGRYVVFQSSLTNLVAGDTNGVMDVFLRDMCLGAPAGCSPTTVRIGASADSPSMSKDARFIFYRSMPDAAVHAYDTCLGQGGGCVPGDVVVSISDVGATVGVALGAYRISRDGRYIAFGGGTTYARDTCLGVTTVCTPSTVVLITTARLDSLSPDGQHVAVTTGETFGDPADTNDTDVYVIKTCVNATGPCTQAAKRISVDAQGIQVGGRDATFSPDGQRIIYAQFFDGGTVITEPLTLP